MADWNTPASLSTLYEDVLTYLKARDVDAITLQVAAPSNLPTGAIKWNRASSKFQEWDGAAFVDMVLALAGGGTGSATAAGARTNLGLGTIATQNANLVAITGGTISGVTMDAGVLTTGQVALARGGTGASLALGASGAILQSNGAAVIFGTDGSALINLNATQLTAGTVPAARLPIASLSASYLPVGSLYFNGSVATNPNTLLGYGTWARFGEGRVIVSQLTADVDFDTAGETGGSKTRTLVEANLPPHQHSVPYSTGFGGAANPTATQANLDNGGGVNFLTGNGPGTSTAFSLMNPYIVAYCWIRTA